MVGGQRRHLLGGTAAFFSFGVRALCVFSSIALAASHGTAWQRRWWSVRPRFSPASKVGGQRRRATSIAWRSCVLLAYRTHSVLPAVGCLEGHSSERALHMSRARWLLSPCSHVLHFEHAPEASANLSQNGHMRRNASTNTRTSGREGVHCMLYTTQDGALEADPDSRWVLFLIIKWTPQLPERRHAK